MKTANNQRPRLEIMKYHDYYTISFFLPLFILLSVYMLSGYAEFFVQLYHHDRHPFSLSYEIFMLIVVSAGYVTGIFIKNHMRKVLKKIINDKLLTITIEKINIKDVLRCYNDIIPDSYKKITDNICGYLTIMTNDEIFEMIPDLRFTLWQTFQNICISSENITSYYELLKFIMKCSSLDPRNWLSDKITHALAHSTFKKHTAELQSIYAEIDPSSSAS